MLLKGKLRSITVWVKETILRYALVMIGLGIALEFGAGMTGQSRTSSKFWREMLPPGDRIRKEAETIIDCERP
jgi:hypothetical protein